MKKTRYTDEQTTFALRQADSMIRLPDCITTGLMSGRTKDAADHTVSLAGNTDNMEAILGARRTIANLIVHLNELSRNNQGVWIWQDPGVAIGRY